ncbi:MAG: hypothetical protein WBH85_08865 [Thermoanaerobaculia bacterium]
MRRQGLLLLLLTATVVVAVQTRAFGFFPQAYALLGRLVLLTLELGLLSLGLVGWGALVLRLLRIREPSYLSVAWGLGAIWTATVMGLTSYVYYPRPWLTLTWLVAGSLAALALRRGLKRDTCELDLGRLRAWFPIFLSIPVVMALVPPISLDSLVYHLAVPSQFALAGRAFEMPWNAHSYFPLHAETLFGLALQLGGGRLAQLVHLLAMILTLVVTVRLGTRLFSPRAGAWSALLLLSTPVLVLIAGWAWNDWFVLLYVALALESHAESKRSAPHYLLTAAFVAGSLAVKYYALPLLLLLVVPIPRPALRRLSAAAAVVAAVALPWYGKNLLTKGNPLYPLLSGQGASQSLISYRGGEPFWERISAYIGRLDLVDESVGVLLLCLFPLLLVLPKKGDQKLRVYWLILLVYLVVALLVSPTVRVFSPLLLVLALLAGGAIVQLRTRRVWRVIGLAAVTAALVVNLAQTLWVVHRYEPLEAAFAFTSDQEYLETGQRYFTAFQWLNQQTAPEDRVLVVGESRIYYLNRVAVAGTYLDPHPIASFRSPGCDHACLANRLWSAGIRWIYFDPTQYGVLSAPRESLSSELLFLVADEEARAFAALLENHTEERLRIGERRVLALMNPSGSDS